MTKPTIKEYQDEIEELQTLNEAHSQALAKRKEDIDKLTLELQAAKKTCAEQQAKLNWLVPVASMAIFNMKAYADLHDVELLCDDILFQIRRMR